MKEDLTEIPSLYNTNKAKQDLGAGPINVSSYSELHKTNWPRIEQDTVL